MAFTSEGTTEIDLPEFGNGSTKTISLYPKGTLKYVMGYLASIVRKPS
jgi:hypothetical protein